MRHRIVVVLLTLLVMALPIAGCGGQQAAQTGGNKSPQASGAGQASEKKDDASADFDWKTLVTKEEAEAILGEPVAPAEYRDTKNPLGQKIVFWKAADELKLSYVQVSLITTAGMGEQLRAAGRNAKKQHDDEKALLKDVQEVSGIGDEAYWDGNSPLISGLHVLKGDYSLSIMVSAKDKQSQLKAEKDLAQKILDRLP